MAHRVAGIAAVNLRRRLGLADDGYVDAFTALQRADLVVMGQPMPGLFGAYLPAGPGRHGGILLNSTMSEATIRHTAAHELGHDTMRPRQLPVGRPRFVRRGRRTAVDRARRSRQRRSPPGFSCRSGRSRRS